MNPAGERSGTANQIEDLIESVVTRNGTDMQAVAAALTDLGLHSVGIASEAGGSGGDLADLVAVLSALGLHAVSSPLLESAMAAWVLTSSGLAVPGGGVSLALTDTAASRDGLLLDDLPAVPWPVADGAVVICPADGPPLLLDFAQPAVRLDMRANLAGEPLARVVLRAPAAVRTMPSGPPHAAIAARLGLLSAARLVGAMRGAFNLTKTYAHRREQFGAPLARLPAVSRSLGLMQVRLIEADTALSRACDLSCDPVRALTGAQVARAVTGWCATEVARTAHQLHGAMGVSAEYPLHRWTRRLWAWRDYAHPERWWTAALGAASIAAGEAAVWDELTASVPT